LTAAIRADRVEGANPRSNGEVLLAQVDPGPDGATPSPTSLVTLLAEHEKGGTLLTTPAGTGMRA
jgi:hypothetical protein